MANFIINSNKQFKIGNYFLNDIDWSKSKYNAFIGLLGSFKDIFIEELDESCRSNRIRFSISITNSRPIYETSNLSCDDSELLEQKVNELLRARVLSRSDSNWSFPVKPIFIDDELEICVDYTKLNQLTIDDSNDVPSIPCVLNSISQSNIFTKIVLKDAFHQLELNENSKHLTAFATDFGHFQFNTFHNGLKNAQKSLQFLLESVLLDVDLNSVRIYLGQILVHTRNYEEHLKILSEIFKSFRSSNVKIDCEESFFLTKELIFLGKEISQYGIAINPVKIAKVSQFPIPTNQTDVRSFVGLINQYKCYVSDFDQLVQPLNALTSTNNSFYWNDELQNAFTTLKNRLISAYPIPLKQLKEVH